MASLVGRGRELLNMSCSLGEPPPPDGLDILRSPSTYHFCVGSVRTTPARLREFWLYEVPQLLSVCWRRRVRDDNK